MALVAFVIALALLEYSFFGMLVGKARGTYEINAPAVTGNVVFESYYRVQQNTLELLIALIPGIVMFGYYVRPDVAAALGLIYIIGRVVYFKAYISDPKSRGLGFILSYLPIQILVIGGLIGAILKMT